VTDQHSVEKNWTSRDLALFAESFTLTVTIPMPHALGVNEGCEVHLGKYLNCVRAGTRIFTGAGQVDALN
jgi:hypothetical protein